MFYKVFSLEVDKNMALVSQALLDDGNRIITGVLFRLSADFRLFHADF